MKKFIALLALIPAALIGATSSVQKDTSSNQITDSLTFGSGKTLQFNSGSTLNIAAGTTVSGVLTATPALTALGAVTPASGALPYFNGTSSATTATLSSFSASLFANTSGSAWLTALGAGGSTSTYVLQTPDAALANSFALSTLSTGLLKVTTTTGALTTAIPNTDYLVPGSAIGGSTGATNNAVLVANGTAGVTAQASTVTIASGVVGWPANTRQTFSPGSSASGLNVGTVSSDPSTPSNGDVWYNSSIPALNARIGGATVALGAGGGGGIGGSTGSTDKAILIANGTGGATAQSSLLTIGTTGIIGYPAGVRQTFSPNTTTPGFNFGSFAGDPSTPVSADCWYNTSSGVIKAQVPSLGARPFVFGPTSSTASNIAVFAASTGGAIQDSASISAISGTLASTSSDIAITSNLGTSTSKVVLKPGSTGAIWEEGYVIQGPSAQPTFQGAATISKGTNIYPLYMQSDGVNGISILAATTTPESILDLQVAGGTTSALSATPNASKSSIRFETTSNGATWREASNIDFVATEIGSSGAGSQIDVYTTATGTTTRTKQATITNAGGVVLYNPTGGLGYTTGAGGAVTQITSRTTGVTLNTVTGAITLVSATGSATWQSFTVTDSAVAATDVPSVVQKSGTDKYIVVVTAVAAGSFQITYETTGGTTTEQPVFQFAIFKGSNS